MKSLFFLCWAFCFLLPPTSDSISWEQNWEQAKKMAQDSQKPILLLFAGSDWCRPCMQWEQEVFDKAEFDQWAANTTILYKADFPRKKKNRLSDELTAQNGLLAQKYNPKGLFPYCLLLNPDGTVLAQTGYLQGGEASFFKWATSHLPESPRP